MDQVPVVGAIAQYSYGSAYAPQFGHVAYVTEVGNGYIVVEEDNWSSTGAGSLDRRRVTYGDRYWPNNFIHIKDQSAGTPPALTPPPTVQSNVTRRSDGSMDLFVRGTDANLTPWHEHLAADGSVISGWESLAPGRVLGAPTATWNPAGTQLDIFAVAVDNSIYHDTYRTTSGWSGWQVVGGGGRAFGGTITATRRPDGTLDMFVRGTDAAMTPWHLRLDANDNLIGGWESLPNGSVLAAPIGSWNAAGDRLDVFAVGVDSSIFRDTYTTAAAGWTGWQVVGGGGGSGDGTIGLTRRPDQSMDLLVRSTDGVTPWHEHLATDGSVINGWESLAPGRILGAPSGTWSMAGDRLDIFAVGVDPTNGTNIFQDTDTASGWSGWVPVGGGGTAA